MHAEMHAIRQERAREPRGWGSPEARELRGGDPKGSPDPDNSPDRVRLRLSEKVPNSLPSKSSRDVAVGGPAAGGPRKAPARNAPARNADAAQMAVGVSMLRRPEIPHHKEYYPPKPPRVSEVLRELHTAEELRELREHGLTAAGPDPDEPSEEEEEEPFEVEADAVVKKLLKGGVEAWVEEGRQAGGRKMVAAVKEKRPPEIVEKLIRKKADVNAVVGGRTALLYLCLEQPSEVPNDTSQLGAVRGLIADMLKDHGAEKALGTAATVKWGWRNSVDTAQLPPETVRSAAEVAKVLLRSLADPNRADSRGLSPLMQASRHDSELIPLLLGSAANVNAATADGRTALMVACRSGIHSTVEKLLRAQADVNATSNDATALIEATRANSRPTVQLLLHAQADMNQRGQMSTSPLMEAAQWNAVDVAELLLENGAASMARDISVAGWTPLQHAAEADACGVAEVLLESRADPALTDRCDRTALDVAYAAGSENVIRLLLKKDAGVKSGLRTF